MATRKWWGGFVVVAVKLHAENKTESLKTNQLREWWMISFKTFVELVIEGALLLGCGWRVWVKKKKGYLNRIGEKCEEKSANPCQNPLLNVCEYLKSWKGDLCNGVYLEWFRLVVMRTSTKHRSRSYMCVLSGIGSLCPRVTFAPWLFGTNTRLSPGVALACLDSEKWFTNAGQVITGRLRRQCLVANDQVMW